ncbi:MAG TPA: DUF6485 family protein [Candidatus Thermoplasmatota archaeon]|nr:DUF6485 family protein [Candidatus Thermoplasmatota archaeon]
MVECKVQQNKKTCNCSYPCSRKGLCCECLRYHRSRQELPACFFPDAIERTYDRSIKNFIQIYQEKEQ